MNDQTTRDYVNAQIHAKLATLTAIGYALSSGQYLDPDTEKVTTAPTGISPRDFLAGFVLEAHTPPSVAYTDFMLSIGGPTVWVRHTTASTRGTCHCPEEWFLMGTAAGLTEPLQIKISATIHHEAMIACEALWDDDICPC